MPTHPTPPRHAPDPVRVEALLRRLANGGPQTPREVAGRIGIEELCLRTWLAEQAAHGDVTYDPRAGTFSLTPEQACRLADGPFTQTENPTRRSVDMTDVQVKSFD